MLSECSAYGQHRGNFRFYCCYWTTFSEAFRKSRSSNTTALYSQIPFVVSFYFNVNELAATARHTCSGGLFLTSAIFRNGCQCLLSVNTSLTRRPFSHYHRNTTCNKHLVFFLFFPPNHPDRKMLAFYLRYCRSHRWKKEKCDRKVMHMPHTV